MDGIMPVSVAIDHHHYHPCGVFWSGRWGSGQVNHRIIIISIIIIVINIIITNIIIVINITGRSALNTLEYHIEETNRRQLTKVKLSLYHHPALWFQRKREKFIFGTKDTEGGLWLIWKTLNSISLQCVVQSQCSEIYKLIFTHLCLQKFSLR